MDLAGRKPAKRRGRPTADTEIVSGAVPVRVVDHEKRNFILDDLAAGKSVREVAKSWSLSKSAVHRMKQRHAADIASRTG